MAVFLMIIGLVLATVFASALGERTGLPWSALLTIVVAPVLFIPGIETVSLDTQLILPIFIPPLLWSLARRTSWAMIRAQAIEVQNMALAAATAELEKARTERRYNPADVDAVLAELDVMVFAAERDALAPPRRSR
ncbi:hypothetical protein [Corynebacterium wankanglinii]|uniref:hypothetical protein n=1 Tax=Corynebacterium wankanglinii TaxID=2735136 RepID=UPI0015E5F5D5|nr:hypothetical protein [Corynebacterium wankanglinii]